MVCVKFENRILADKHFIQWASIQKDKGNIFRKLMYIKSKSEYHKKCHNVIEFDHADYCIKQKIIKDSILGGAFKVYPVPFKFISIADPITRTIKYAVSLTNEKPFNCYVFTSPEKISEYSNNLHYKTVKSIDVKSGNDALKIIKTYFSEYERARMLYK